MSGFIGFFYGFTRCCRGKFFFTLAAEELSEYRQFLMPLTVTSEIQLAISLNQMKDESSAKEN